MRIIGGKFKSRRFYPPADNWPTRPTTDFAKEGLFNMLQNSLDFQDLKVLDLFGGTGSHGYEFISRGCTDVTYVDKFGGCVAFAQKTAKVLEIEDHMNIYKNDVFKFIQRNTYQYDYIFAGPPYALPTIDTIPDEIFKHNTLAPDGIFVLEHTITQEYDKHPNFVKSRKYGASIFSFFENLED